MAEGAAIAVEGRKAPKLEEVAWPPQA